MKPKTPTRVDVAELAGVAPSTVSLILGGRGDSLSIPMHTQERVKEAARQLGYVSNKLIQAIKKGRTGLVGVYLRWEQWASPFGYWTELMWWLQAAAPEFGFQLLPHHARRGISTEQAFASQAGGLVDGVLIFNSGRDDIVGRLLEAQLPAVEIGDPFSSLPFVASDGASGVMDAMRHLKARGFTRPAYLSHESQYVKDQLGRVTAFHKACEELGMESGPEMSAVVLGGDPAAPVYLSLPNRPDAVICGSDEMAFGLLGFALKQGIKVPQELAVVGFDAIQTPLSFPKLTSIQTPHEKLASLALEKLKAIIDGCEYEHETVLVPGLRLGDTT